MTLWAHELRLFGRERAALPALLLMLALSAGSVWAGMAEIAHQRAVIARIQPAQAADVAALARGRSPGDAPYNTFHATWDPPSRLAFAAIGQRDVAPYILRVRALGLESQIYEGEAYNPELALPGRFDFAYLLPLFAIVLFHDLRSGERAAGRLAALRSVARNDRLLWLRRRVVRGGLLLLAVLVPFLAGAVLAGVAASAILTVIGIAAAYLLFWIVVAALVERRGWRSVTNAGTLAATWLGLTLVLPALGQLAINGTVPAAQGVELTLAHRQKVHAAWEIPREVTLAQFYRTNPRWANAPPPKGFDSKWYFAFHDVADESVAPAARAYRAGLVKRDAWTTRVAWVLPAVGVQTALHRMADTDLNAQLAYQDRIRAFHADLREFYYRYLFTETPFTKEDFGKAPMWGGR